MNDLTTTSSSGQMKDFFDQLPTPPKEKVFRGIWYTSLSLAGLAGFLFIMPFVNQALALGLAGATLLAQLGALGLALAIGTYVVMSFKEPFQRWVESLARQTTIAVFGEDPITPLHMWLKEVHEDCEVIERSTHEIGGIVAENEQTVQENLALLNKADKRFATAVRQFGEQSTEARTASIEASGYKDRAANAAQTNGPLKELYEILVEVANVARLSEREAEMAIGTAEQDWRTALKAEKAMSSAQRSLNKRSVRYNNATAALDIIRQKYSGTFGQLRSLRRLSEDAISKMNLSGAVSHDEALERLREQSQKMLGYSPAVQLPDLTAGNAADRVRAGSSGGTVDDLKLFDNN